MFHLVVFRIAKSQLAYDFAYTKFSPETNSAASPTTRSLRESAKRRAQRKMLRSWPLGHPRRLGYSVKDTDSTTRAQDGSLAGEAYMERMHTDEFPKSAPSIIPIAVRPLICVWLGSKAKSSTPDKSAPSRFGAALQPRN